MARSPICWSRTVAIGVSSSSKAKNWSGPSRIAFSTRLSSFPPGARSRFRSAVWSGAGGHINPSISVPAAGIRLRSVRYTLKASVSRFAFRRVWPQFGLRAKVWEEVDKQQAALGVSSKTAAMADSFEARQPMIDRYAEQFQYPEGAAGLAVAVGDKIVAVDLFDNPATCRKVWRRLLSGFILDAVGQTTGTGQATQPAVEQTLAALRNYVFGRRFRPVGDGEEYRVKSEDGTQASALAFADSLVHGSLLTGA